MKKSRLSGSRLHKTQNVIVSLARSVAIRFHNDQEFHA
jgi:hypothetical protein